MVLSQAIQLEPQQFQHPLSCFIFFIFFLTSLSSTMDCGSSITYFKFLLLILFVARRGGEGTEVKLTLTNECTYMIWPGIQANPGSILLAEGGFALASGQSATMAVPRGWAGRFWARTGCVSTPGGEVTCASADCGAGQVQCRGRGATPPATLVEFSLASSGGGDDFYNVSLVDGYNLAVSVLPQGGSGTCGIARCAHDLNPHCPPELQVSTVGGLLVGCRSACDAFRRAEYCCSGAYANPSTCKPSAYSHLFKTLCPDAYSYAYDDPTSTFTCDGSSAYTLIFCPSISEQISRSNNTISEKGGSTTATTTTSSDNNNGGVVAALLWNSHYTNEAPSLLASFQSLYIKKFLIIAITTILIIVY